MGVENNEVVLATTWSVGALAKINDWINTLEEKYKPLFIKVDSIENCKCTIMMAPDGSKKGWGTAIKAAEIRKDFIELLKSFDYEDGSSSVEWVEVGYGEFGQKVLSGNCKNRYNDKEYAADEA